MKLNEQQLAQLYRQHKAQSIDTGVDSLLNSTNASDKRINDVEQIANNSRLSAAYQVIHQLQKWSNDVNQDINKQLNKNQSFNFLFNWLKPSLATAAIAMLVYMAVPNLNSPIESMQQPKHDQMMFSGSFEKGNQRVLPVNSKLKSDVIYRGDFG